MGVPMLGSQSSGQHQQSHMHPIQLSGQNFRFSLTLSQLESQFGNLGKPLSSMDLVELLNNVWSTSENQSMGMDTENTFSESSLQRQSSFTLARALSGKTVEQVWEEIRQGQKKRSCKEIKTQEREPTLGETTLEDFLVQAGLYAEASTRPSMELVSIDSVTPPSFSQKMDYSSSLSTGALSDTPVSVRKRDAPDDLETRMEKRLRRKMMNRESAARSRARKQNYHNELVSKVSQLKEDNIKLTKEKEFEKMLRSESSPGPRYQLRRTSSAPL